MKDCLPTLLSPISERQAYLMNPLVLAFVGDAVQQLYVRTRLSVESDRKAGDLHRAAVDEIKAVAQSSAAERLLPLFNEAELDIFKRARNSKTTTPAKNAPLSDYKKASGLEAVLGYLYLSGNHERLYVLLHADKGE